MEKLKTIEIPSEFKRLFDSDWREAAVFGGRYSLKSHTVARVLLIRARASKIRVGCFREFQNSMAESSHQLLSDLIRKYNLTDFSITDRAIINTVNGSDFLFKGLWNNEQSIKSIEGIDIGWVEEAQTISKESLEVLTPTIRKPGSQIIYTYNRLTEDDPIHNRLVLEGRPNTLVLNVNYDIAIKYGMMPKVIRDEIEDDKSNRPALYRHKWLGEPSTSERKVYKDWQILDEIDHHARLVGYGLDFGYSNDPSCLVAIYYHNGGYILDEIFYLKGMSNKQIADNIKNHEQAMVVADSAEPKSIDEIMSYGINIVPAEKGRDSVEHGIQLIQNQRISITKRSVNMVREYKNYLWKTDKDGNVAVNPSVPEHTFSHSMDALRYGLVSMLKQPEIKYVASPAVVDYYPEIGH
jgi:phage terminase large subunit